MRVLKRVVVCCIVFVAFAGWCDVSRSARVGAVVTNDFDVADFAVCFKAVEASSTNAIFQFREEGPRFTYVIDDAELRSNSPGERISLSVRQRLKVVERHFGLVIEGFEGAESRGFMLTKYFDARSFGRGVTFWTGRMLLASRDRNIKSGDIVIVGARELEAELLESHKGGLHAPEIEALFEDLAKAYKSKDVDRIKKIAGNSAERWLRWLDGNEQLGSIVIVTCSTNNAVVKSKVTLLGRGDDPYAFDAKYTMSKIDGAYCIENMEVSDGWNRLFDATVETSSRLIKAINERNLSSVRELLYYCETNDVSVALAERGMLWVKNAIDNGVRISENRMKVQCEGGKYMIGLISVPEVPGGTNIMRKVYFRSGHIQRDAMAEDPILKMGFHEWLKAKYGGQQGQT